MEGHRLRLHRLPKILVNDTSSNINSRTSLGLRGRRVVIIIYRHHLRHHHCRINSQRRQRQLQISICERTRVRSLEQCRLLMFLIVCQFRVRGVWMRQIRIRRRKSKRRRRRKKKSRWREVVVVGRYLSISMLRRHNSEEDTHYADDRVYDHRRRYRRCSVPVRLPNRLLHHLAYPHHHQLRQRPTVHRMVMPTQSLCPSSRESKSTR